MYVSVSVIISVSGCASLSPPEQDVRLDSSNRSHDLRKAISESRSTSLKYMSCVHTKLYVHHVVLHEVVYNMNEYRILSNQLFARGICSWVFNFSELLIFKNLCFFRSPDTFEECMSHPPTAPYAFDSDTPGDPLPTARGPTQVFVFMHIHYPISAWALPNLIHTYATSHLI